MKEKIGEKLKRFANLPHVIEKRRKLRAMYYLSKKEGGELNFKKYNVLVETASDSKMERTVAIVTCWIPIPGCYASDPIARLVLFPMDTYTSYGEEPSFHTYLKNPKNEDQ